MKKMNRWVCIVFAFLLMFGNFSMTVRAAKNEEETTSEKGKLVKLEKYEGEVQICNASDKVQKIREGRRLYNGYKVSTKEGYAWISLDDNKLLKLDWYSSVHIRKDKKKLEVLLENGSMFFNVDKPLEEDESLDIKTSGMSTGVRGTIGMVTIQRKQEAMSMQELSYVQLYEGKVGISYYEEETGIKVQNIEPGMVVDVKTHRINEEDAVLIPVSSGEVTDESLKENLMDIGFVAVEIKNNEEIQQRIIEGDNDVDDAAMKEIIDNADKQLEKDQEVVRREVEEIQNTIEKEVNAIIALKNPDLTGNAVPAGEVDQVFSEEIVFELIPPKDAPVRLEKKEEIKEEIKDEIKEDVKEETKETADAEKEQKPVKQEAVKKEELKPIPPVVMTEVAPPEQEETKTEPPDNSDSTGGSVPTLPKPEELVKEYEITFQYVEGNQNIPFASMKVRSDEIPQRPHLRPAGPGTRWCLNDGSEFEFDKKITENITLTWK